MIKQTYLINAPIEKVWQALVKPNIIEAWSSGPVEMSDKIGAKFSLWGGDIWGRNLKVKTGKKLEQEWYGGKWGKPSIVTFTLKRHGDSTEVNLVHKDVPKGEEKNFADGWKKYYFGEIKRLLES